MFENLFVSFPASTKRMQMKESVDIEYINFFIIATKYVHVFERKEEKDSVWLKAEYHNSMRYQLQIFLMADGM